MNLNFLGAIEGLAGEELASAGLSFLVVHSPVFREKLIRRVAQRLPQALTPSFSRGVFCTCEYATTSEKNDAGRIDILVCDGEPGRTTFALAIEVKLWAAFTDDQPKKYRKRLRELVRPSDWASDFAPREELSEELLNDPSAPRLIAVVCPEQRTAKVAERLRAQKIDGISVVWNWNDIRSDIAETARDEGKLIGSAAEWLLRYLDSQLGSVLLPGGPSAYVGDHVLLGNDYHEKFLYRLKAIVPEPGRMSRHTDYIGFSCRTVADEASSPKSVPAWIGFRKLSSGTVVFGIHTDLPTEANDESNWFGREFRTLPFNTSQRAQDIFGWGEILLKDLRDIQNDQRRPKVAAAQ